MAEHRFAIEIMAPPETVYDVWVDPSRMPEWNEGMSKVTVISGEPGRPGTRYSVSFGRRTAAGAEILIAERPTRFAWRLRLGPLTAEFDSTFEASPGGTSMTEAVRTRGVVGWAWNRILSTGGYGGSFRGELKTFKAICEREQSRG